MFGFNTTNGRIDELNRELRGVKYTLETREDEIERLNDKISRFNRTKELYERKAEDEKEDIRHSIKQKIKTLEQENNDIGVRVEELSDTIRELRVILDQHADLDAREVEIEAKVAILEALKQGAADFESKLQSTQDKADNLAEARYDAGYKAGEADGRAEGMVKGLEKANELAAADRQAAYQVAFIAAGIRNPDASDEVTKLASKTVEAVSKAKVAPTTINNSN